jgi:cell division protein FtsN
MAKDYKHRAYVRDQQSKRRKSKQSNNLFGIVRWMLVTALLIGFAVFLVYLKSLGDKPPGVSTISQATDIQSKTQDKPAENKPKKAAAHTPKFEFYTILPKKEQIVPDYEVKTRTREAQVGKNKKTSYVLQAGSYRTPEEADQMKAKLALMGIESKIKRAKVESTLWYIVKIGPYQQINSINTLMTRLQQNGVRPIVTEVDQ